MCVSCVCLEVGRLWAGHPWRRGLILGKDKWVSCSAICSDAFLSKPNFCSIVNGLLRRRRAAGRETRHFPLSSGSMKNEWSYNSTSLHAFLECTGDYLLHVVFDVYLAAVTRVNLWDKTLGFLLRNAQPDSRDVQEWTKIDPRYFSK